MSASAGKVLLTPKGDYNASATYSILDWVRYNGAVYVAKQTTTGNLPTDTTYWSLMLNAPTNLADLTDVDIDTTTLADGQTLVYNATTGKFENGESSGGVGKDLTGQTVKPQYNVTTTAGTNAEILNDYRERTFSGIYAETGNVASGEYSHAEGSKATASGASSHAEGLLSSATGDTSHAEGYKTNATGNYSHAEGNQTTASGNYSHTEGIGTTASSDYSHAEGRNTIASGTSSHAEGSNTSASKETAHAEGWYTTASGLRSHAEGNHTTASAESAHAEGYYTTASGNYSHAEGYYTAAVGEGSFVGGYGNAENVVKDDGNGSNFLFGRWAIPKFNGVTALPTHGTNSSFGFHAGTVSVHANTSAARTHGNGTGACIYDGAYTDKVKLEYQAIYILVTNAINATTGAQRGSSCYMVVGAGSESNTTPVLVALGTTGTPPTVSVASNNVLNVKNESATYCSQYNLIRVA